MPRKIEQSLSKIHHRTDTVIRQRTLLKHLYIVLGTKHSQTYSPQEPPKYFAQTMISITTASNRFWKTNGYAEMATNQLQST